MSAIPERTAVAIAGAGPAGLLLAHLLRRHGIDVVVLERATREHVLGRVRAGVLEDPVVDLLTEVGVAERLRAEGLVHSGLRIQYDGGRHRLDLRDLAGQTLTVYGQQRLVGDLIELHEGAGTPLHFETEVVGADGIETTAPVVHWRSGTRTGRLAARYVVAVDGARSTLRELVPPARRRSYLRQYPAAWLGILAEAAPATDELVYARHEEGFALASMRSPSVTRLYLQVPDTDRLEDWPADRLWTQLERRLGLQDAPLGRGRVLERSMTPLRSVVHTTMRHGSLLLAGDAAHVVPPTGAKGLNLAVGDVLVASRVIAAALSGAESELDGYAERCLPRIWAAVHFSWWMTTMLHQLDEDPFGQQMWRTQLDDLVGGGALAQWFAQHYTGRPLPS